MDWLSYFQCNRRDRLPIPWEQGIAVPPHLRAPLIRSLQRFQVGEQGDGVHLKAGAAATGDPVYEAAIALFVAEEQEHSRLLARVLRAMGAELLPGHWSDGCFRAVRHLAGLHLEILVLLVAELIARRYYRALQEGTEDTVLRVVFAQIVRDELGHVAFHCDRLNRAFASLPTPARFLISTTWRAFFGAVTLVVMVDHRAVLRAVGVAPWAFWRDCGEIFEEAAGQIFGAPVPFEDVRARTPAQRVG
jgi:hypothetical protein